MIVHVVHSMLTFEHWWHEIQKVNRSLQQLRFHIGLIEDWMNIFFFQLNSCLEGQPRNGSLIFLLQSNNDTEIYSLTLVS